MTEPISNSDVVAHSVAQKKINNTQNTDPCEYLPGISIFNWIETYLNNIRRTLILRCLHYLAKQRFFPIWSIYMGYKGELVLLINSLSKDKLKMGRKPIPDMEKVPLIIRAFEMKAQGIANTVIANETMLFASPSSYWNKLFGNLIYTGVYKFLNKVYYNIYPREISDILFESIQQHLHKQRPGGKNG